MEDAFEDAMLGDFDQFLCVCADIPDAEDHHVVAAALKTQAAVGRSRKNLQVVRDDSGLNFNGLHSSTYDFVAGD